MKKIIIALLILAVLVLSGCKSSVTGGAVVCNKPYILVGTDCCLDSNDNQVCDKDETEPTAEPVELPIEETQTIVEEPEALKEETTSLATNKFEIKLGESVIFDGKTVKLVGVENMPRLRGIYSVDGIERDVYDTKDTELVNGIKITNLKYLNLENGFIVELEKLILGEDEYLMNTREDVTIKGKTFNLYDVTESEDVRKINLLITGTDIEPSRLILKEGETETLAGLKITNLYAFPSGFKNERQAIIKIQ